MTPGVPPDSSTSSVSLATAIAVTDAVSTTVGSALDVAVRTCVSRSPSSASAGTSTRTQTTSLSPGWIVPVAVTGVLQVASSTDVSQCWSTVRSYDAGW